MDNNRSKDHGEYDEVISDDEMDNLEIQIPVPTFEPSDNPVSDLDRNEYLLAVQEDWTKLKNCP